MGFIEFYQLLCGMVESVEVTVSGETRILLDSFAFSSNENDIPLSLINRDTHADSDPDSDDSADDDDGEEENEDENERKKKHGGYSNRWEHRFVKLYNRYIADGATYQLNLPGWLTTQGKAMIVHMDRTKNSGSFTNHMALRHRDTRMNTKGSDAAAVVAKEKARAGAAATAKEEVVMMDDRMIGLGGSLMDSSTRMAIAEDHETSVMALSQLRIYSVSSAEVITPPTSPKARVPPPPPPRPSLHDRIMRDESLKQTPRVRPANFSVVRVLYCLDYVFWFGGCLVNMMEYKQFSNRATVAQGWRTTIALSILSHAPSRLTVTMNTPRISHIVTLEDIEDISVAILKETVALIKDSFTRFKNDYLFIKFCDYIDQSELD